MSNQVEPTALLVAGDTHGNPNHIMYLFQRALAQDVDAIFQVGDFGYWEHDPDGGAYLDLVSDLAVSNAMPFYWIDGNHENHTLLREKYADAPRTSEGFWVIRDGLYYVPRGARWTWNGVSLMGFGGAISIDKNWRLDVEKNGGIKRNGRRGPAPGPRTLWWPEEETTDAELALALQDPAPVDILFTHDKPRASTPPWNNKDLPELWPVQDRVQTLVRTLKPKLLIHGHLHIRYTDRIRCGDDGEHTVVEGLDCDDNSPKKNSWVRLELSHGS